MKPIVKLMTLSLVSFIVFSCDSPTDTDQETGPSFQITGTVALAGNWPETGQVLVNLFSKEDIDANTWSNVRDFEALTSDDLDYTFEDVSVGDYYLILSWYDTSNTDPATNQHIFGWHGTYQPPYPIFTTVSMTEEDNLIYVNFLGDMEVICDGLFCVPEL